VNVLFVCRGNTCRSPLAEVIARSVAPDGFTFRSAGLEPGAAIEPDTVAVAAERGYGDLGGHRPTGLTDELRAWADAVFVMEASQLACAAGARSVAGTDVPDPWRCGMAAYRATCDQLEAAIRDRLAELR
jgi:protein-tyrosine-phosphatase